MDRDRVKAQLWNVDRLLDDDNPGLLALVVQANGTGLLMSLPFLELVTEEGTLEQRHAALTLIRAFLRDVDDGLQLSLDEILRARTSP